MKAKLLKRVISGMSKVTSLCESTSDSIEVINQKLFEAYAEGTDMNSYFSANDLQDLKIRLFDVCQETNSERAYWTMYMIDLEIEHEFMLDLKY